MKTRPILFSAEMVRAILRADHPKTQTRRVVKPQPTRAISSFTQDAEAGDRVLYHWWPHRLVESRGCHKAAAGELNPIKIMGPYGVPGDGLYLRETWSTELRYEDVKPRDLPLTAKIWYAADRRDKALDQGRWRPSIHMPKWVSRIPLEVLSVRVERVQEISARDAWAEGVRCDCTSPVPQCAGNINAFWGLWDSINAKRGYSWAVNPWVWVVGFKVVGD